jgi:hypothetical protein
MERPASAWEPLSRELFTAHCAQEGQEGLLGSGHGAEPQRGHMKMERWVSRNSDGDTPVSLPRKNNAFNTPLFENVGFLITLTDVHWPLHQLQEKVYEFWGGHL